MRKKWLRDHHCHTLRLNVNKKIEIEITEKKYQIFQKFQKIYFALLLWIFRHE